MTTKTRNFRHGKPWNPSKAEKIVDKTTNRAFSKEQSFLELCQQHDVKPTKRQASKFRNQRGKLYNAVH